MSSRQSPAGWYGFSDDVPQRLERLQEASGRSWRGLARAPGVNVRSLYRWRAGIHLIVLLELASERDLLDCLSEHMEQAGSDAPQAVLNNVDERG